MGSQKTAITKEVIEQLDALAHEIITQEEIESLIKEEIINVSAGQIFFNHHGRGTELDPPTRFAVAILLKNAEGHIGVPVDLEIAKLQIGQIVSLSRHIAARLKEGGKLTQQAVN